MARKAGYFIAAAALAVAGTAHGAQTASDTTQAAALARQLYDTIALQPDGTPASSYTGQLTATLDRSSQPCPIVVAALQQVRGEKVTVEAQKALSELTARLRGCSNFGTAGVTGGAGQAAFSTGPTFSIGGGSSDYAQ